MVGFALPTAVGAFPEPVGGLDLVFLTAVVITAHNYNPHKETGDDSRISNNFPITIQKSAPEMSREHCHPFKKNDGK